MNQNFKSKFNQPSSNNVTEDTRVKNVKANAPDIELYDQYSGIRNVCFNFLDGNRIFLNYNYLVCSEFDSSKNQITLSFTTHIVILNGINLGWIFEELLFHSIQLISCRDVRYNQLLEEDCSIVNSIDIKTP